MNNRLRHGTKWQITLDLIAKFHISHKLLCEILEMNRSVFGEKWNETRTYRFTDVEKQKITHYLLSMGKILVENLID